MKRNRLWARLTPTLETFFKLALDGKPTPGRLRFIAEVFLELREIMLKDDLEHSLTLEAADAIDMWIKGLPDFDLQKELRDIRELAEVLSLDRKEEKRKNGKKRKKDREDR